MSDTHEPGMPKDQIPEDLREFESSVDRLAGLERRAADSGLESRLYDASRGAIQPSFRSSLRFPASASRVWLRAAAGLALVIGAGMTAYWASSSLLPSGSAPRILAGPSAGSVDVEVIRGELEEFLAEAESLPGLDLAEADTESFWQTDDDTIMEDSL